MKRKRREEEKKKSSNLERPHIYDTLNKLTWIDGRSDEGYSAERFIETTLGQKSNSRDVVEKKLSRKVVMLDNPGAKRKYNMQSRRQPLNYCVKTRREDKIIETLPSFEECGLIHRMWKEYAKKIFQELHSKDKIAEQVHRLDFHGALVRIVQSKNPSLVSLAVYHQYCSAKIQNLKKKKKR